MPDSEQRSTERLLGTLVADVSNLKSSMARVETQLNEQRRRWERVETELSRDIQSLRDFTLELKGGRKALFALLGVASVLGGVIWEILQRIVVSK